MIKKTLLTLSITLCLSLSLSACNNAADNQDDTAVKKNNSEENNSNEDTQNNTSNNSDEGSLENQFEGSAASTPANDRVKNLLKVSGSNDNDSIYASGESSDFDVYDTNDEVLNDGEIFSSDADEDNEDDENDEEERTTPTYFDVGDSMVFAVGDYDKKKADEIIELINAERTTFEIDLATKNPSMCIVADVRAKENSMLTGHSRVNGAPYYSVADKYFKAECLLVSERECTPQEIVDSWMEMNNTRRILLEKDYKSIGASYFVCGDYVLSAVAFGY